VFKPAGIFFCGALMLLAGCATTPDTAAPSDWSATAATPKPGLPPPRATAAPAVKTNSPAGQPVAPAMTTPITTWTSLDRWMAGRSLGVPHRVAEGPLATYAVSSTNGVLVLAIGTQTAIWRGVEINLGFEPQLIDGQLFVHGLDLQKNLEPLLCGTPLAYGRSRVIVIDPGHGGVNVGTKSVLDGRFEKEFTLDWARRLKPLLAADGWTVFLTRTNDTDFSLADRAAFADAHHADLFISLHFNSAAPDTRQAGLETYCLTPTGMPSTLTRGYTDFWSETFPNNAYDAENLRLAVRLHAALLDASGEDDRGVRHARFIGVLHGQHRPAVLIEGGYLSNPHEARLIEDPEFRQNLAEAVARALK
jgi:N-acetylmuramoyl-L-alanine amidase